MGTKYLINLKYHLDAEICTFKFYIEIRTITRMELGSLLSPPLMPVETVWARFNFVVMEMHSFYNLDELPPSESIIGNISEFIGADM